MITFMTKLFDGLTYFNDTNRAEPIGRKKKNLILHRQQSNSVTGYMIYIRNG